MARIDYGQVPACSPPGNEATYETTYYRIELYYLEKKWIEDKYLNHHGTRKKRVGTKALVGVNPKTGQWNIIRLCEVV